MILGDSPVVAKSDVCNSGQLAVVAVIARDILANTAQEQAHVFRATMMLPTGSHTGVPCCAGAGSRGTKKGPYAPFSPPRGPSAIYGRPSRPFGLRSLMRDAGINRQALHRKIFNSFLTKFHSKFFIDFDNNQNKYLDYFNISGSQKSNI